MSNYGMVRFQTLNSDYVATWERGQRMARLTCLAGTFGGQTFEVQAEDVRDLAWPGEAPTFTGADFRPVIATTAIVSATRTP
jgi:hypothetical protein